MPRVKAVCEYVRDGDTFRTVRKNWIRLANVCCPEQGEPGWMKAKNILEKLVLGKAITYEQVGTSYSRIVAEVWVNDIHVNSYMRRQGYTCS